MINFYHLMYTTMFIALNVVHTDGMPNFTWFLSFLAKNDIVTASDNVERNQYHIHYSYNYIIRINVNRIAGSLAISYSIQPSLDLIALPNTVIQACLKGLSWVRCVICLVLDETFARFCYTHSSVNLCVVKMLHFVS